MSTVTELAVATRPPEARGLTRDGVRLLVAAQDGVTHARFAELPRFLRRGDLVVVNTSGTLAAAVDGQRSGGRAVTVHFSTRLDARTWFVELRPPGRATGPCPDVVAGEVVEFPDTTMTVLAPHPGGRLWRAELTDGPALLAAHGRPITYSYVAGRWPLADYQTVFATEPGSAEMPSAGRPFSTATVTALVNAGVVLAPLTLHTGVSSPTKGEPPLAEPYSVPERTADLVNLTRARGGRVVAVGTTVTRALETVADRDGTVRSGRGWTELVLGPGRPARVVDGLVTGWHEPGASHLMLLEAVAGAELVDRAYRAAARERYLWHEFGDSCLLLPGERCTVAQ